jgi:hypothetical protein
MEGQRVHQLLSDLSFHFSTLKKHPYATGSNRSEAKQLEFLRILNRTFPVTDKEKTLAELVRALAGASTFKTCLRMLNRPSLCLWAGPVAITDMLGLRGTATVLVRNSEYVLGPATAAPLHPERKRSRRERGGRDRGERRAPTGQEPVLAAADCMNLLAELDLAEDTPAVASGSPSGPAPADFPALPSPAASSPVPSNNPSPPGGPSPPGAPGSPEASSPEKALVIARSPSYINWGDLVDGQ